MSTPAATSSSSIKVAVRCRPLNSREIARGAKPLIRISGNQTMLDRPESNSEDTGNPKAHTSSTSARSHSFAFDHSYDSSGSRDDPGYASQQTLFDDLGRDLLDHAFQGYNTCIFAYGQTGSGKSYSMMGYGADRGIIPLTCSALFDRIAETTSETLSYTVEVSFIEIYNEKVRDLLNPKNKGNLKVREHPSLGPYVEDLSKLGVETFSDMERLMDEGNKARTVAATQMNETSSRSHSVFTVLLTQKRLDVETKMVGEKVSRISLVDLAGSERANSTGATGQRLKEGANINKSLSTLGKVIAALAAASSAAASGKKKPTTIVPYRDSVLTWLLKDSLGGNSKTAMIAAISPADYEETLSTLRYADQAKKIQNKAIVNEDANAKFVRELKEELAMLRARVSGATSESTYDPLIPPEKQIVSYKTSSGEIKTVTKAELQEQLEQSEKLMADVNQTWEEKMEKTVIIQKEREKALEELGIVIEKGNVGVHTPKKMPHLVNLCEDPLMSECLIYQIKPGKTVVGNVDSTEHLDIRLSGPNVLPVHCYFESSPNGTVELHAMPGGTTMVNGLRIGSDKPKRLRSSYRIILGDLHVFRFNHPEEVRRNRDSRAFGTSPLVKSDTIEDLKAEEESGTSGVSSPARRPASPTASAADWKYAAREAVISRLNGTDIDLDSLEDSDLNRLFEDLMKVRSHRRNGTSLGRPESRASFLDSIGEDDDDGTASGSFSGRPFSGDTWNTDDTSLDSALRFNGPGASAEMEHRLKLAMDELQQELDTQKAEYEAKLRDLAEATHKEEVNREAEQQLRVLQAEMQEQRKEYEKQMKKLARRTASRLKNGESEPEIYDENDLRLVNMVLERWRSLKRVSLAQTLLSKAVLLKEANVFSREFDKKVTYQFAIVDQLGIPASALEGISALAEVEDFSDPALTNVKEPVVAVKVLDKRNSCLYLWSIERLQHRVQQMHRLYSLLDKPSYSSHFNLEDPFYQDSPPTHSFIGTAFFPLAPLAKKLLLASSLRIFSRYTGQQIATCFLRLKPLGVTSSASPHDSGLRPELTDDCHLTFELNVDSVSGLDPSDITSLHCQVRQSSISGTREGPDDILVSPLATIDATGTTKLRLRKTISIQITPDTLTHLQTRKAYIEFFAQVKPSYLYKCEKWDETKEEKPPLLPWQLDRNQSDLERDSTGRRAETELLTEQVYDLKCMVSIQELSSTGKYEPVQLVSASSLDPGVFHCHQGLQRRLAITLSHGSGRHWLWKGLKNVKIGKVRLLDAKGHILDSRNDHPLQLKNLKKSADIEYNSNGTTVLSLIAGWDSSAHNSLFLNRITATSNRVLLEISWDLDVAGVETPIPFSVDIGLQMQERDSKTGYRLFNRFFNNTKITTKATHMFQVRLAPNVVNKPGELWRLNTASTFVRGEEVLQSWKPRGVSLVEDYYRLLTTEKNLADLAVTQSVLASIPPVRLLSSTTGVEEDSKLWLFLELWRRNFGTRENIKLVQDPTWDDVKHALDQTSGANGSTSNTDGSTKTKKMKATLQHVPKAETVAKKGYLYFMTDQSSPNEGPRWEKVWAVLRRPYLSIYSSSNEMEELPHVINISTVRVDHSSELEEVLSRKFAFGIYTPVSAFFVSAQTFPEMLQWISLIDPSWERNA